MFVHDLPFDPTYGYSADDLARVGAPEAPTGFDEFWQETYEENARIPVRYDRDPVACHDPRYDVSIVRYDSWDGFRTGSWLALPRDGTIQRGVVIGHGYGGREEPSFELDIPGTALLFPCARGFHISPHPLCPSNDSFRHVCFGVRSREGYIIRGCVAELWTAASVLLELVPEIEDRLYYFGGSFGGGLGALMLPWERRFRKACLSVPTFGNHPIRLKCPCMGSGEAVRRYHKHHPEIFEVLRYYDAAIAAQRIRIPVLTSPALFDPSVPPPGQFAVCNSLGGPEKRIVLSAGHFEYADELKEVHVRNSAAKDWLCEDSV